MHYLASVVGENESFEVIAYRLRPIHAMLIKEDDTRALRKALIDDHLISRIQEDMVFEVESDVVNKNGVEFVSIKTEMVDGDQTIFGKMLFAKKKDYIVMFLFLEVDKSGKVMDQIMDSISFQ